MGFRIWDLIPLYLGNWIQDMLLLEAHKQLAPRLSPFLDWLARQVAPAAECLNDTTYKGPCILQITVKHLQIGALETLLD